ncbi:YehR family protein [Oceanobacillus sp. CFH 90083]|uniref:YehR family protein n=1 Tax=Oceanobacillus sp. CFH 90083 TaxID=2592336 RepID=UPI00128BC8DA|nr:YehR family protein [Oceanobacillus sp. CFH 90083]
MKKWLMLCMALLICIALVACGSNDSNDDEDTNGNETAEDTTEDAAEDESADAEEDTATEENDAEEESNADAEGEADTENDAAAESQAFDFDPTGENTVTLQLEEAGVIVKLTYKADGDMVYEQTADNEIPYSTIGASTQEEAEEIMGEYTSEYEDVEGVTHNLEYLDDKIVETLTVNYNEADANEVSQLTGADFEGDLSRGVSLQQSVQMLQAQGYEIVEE